MKSMNKNTYSKTYDKFNSPFKSTNDSLENSLNDYTKTITNLKLVDDMLEKENKSTNLIAKFGSTFNNDEFQPVAEEIPEVFEQSEVNSCNISDKISKQYMNKDYND